MSVLPSSEVMKCICSWHFRCGLVSPGYLCVLIVTCGCRGAAGSMGDMRSSSFHGRRACMAELQQQGFCPTTAISLVPALRRTDVPRASRCPGSYSILPEGTFLEPKPLLLLSSTGTGVNKEQGMCTLELHRAARHKPCQNNVQTKSVTNQRLWRNNTIKVICVTFPSCDFSLGRFHLQEN